MPNDLKMGAAAEAPTSTLRGEAAAGDNSKTGPDLPADSAPETNPASPPGGKTGKAKGVDIIMMARRPWSIGESIGLSRGYTFVPAEVTEVAAEDAVVLCGREWDGRTFQRASA